ncbi:MAG: SPASM domain-containing protein [Candidatus Aminicenantes bacterium]
MDLMQAQKRNPYLLSYMYNSQNNPCWGGKVAITKKEEIKPCIYSRIILGKLKRDSIEDVFPKILEYWSITKKKIEKCRDCEFRFLCSDCREIAFRENKNLYDSNPLCNYDPYSGNWQ